MKYKYILALLSVTLILMAALIFANSSFNRRNYVNSSFSEAEARKIAEKTCVKGGEALSKGYYDVNTKSWLYEANLNVTREGCSPVCSVSEDTKTAEIKWQCMAVELPEESEEVQCGDKSKNTGFCTKIYDPVCATVEVQCIKAPCNPVQETFSNSCEACNNPLVNSYRKGECEGEAPKEK